MAFISYTERPISALSSAWEARAGLIWVDFNFVMSQQASVRWSLNSWAAQANHGHPTAAGVARVDWKLSVWVNDQPYKTFDTDQFRTLKQRVYLMGIFFSCFSG